MVLTPAVCAFFRHAVPDSESRLTIIRTLTPLLIIPSQIVPNLDLSPPAFWMSGVRPAFFRAAVSCGRSWDSHRGDVDASGRITPTLPLAGLLEPLAPLELLLLSLELPQAASELSLIAIPATAHGERLRM